MIFMYKDKAQDAADTILEELAELKEAHDTIHEQLDGKDFDEDVEIDLKEIDIWIGTLESVVVKIRNEYDYLYESR